MSHTAMKDGTVFYIGGGRAMSNGTTHEVESGRTKVGGTTYDIDLLFGLPSKRLSLNDMTWEEIRIVSDAGKAANYFSIGDRKGVHLKGTLSDIALDTTYYCYIIGIDHNSNIEGSNRIHFQFGYTNLVGGVNVGLCDSAYMSGPNDGVWLNMNNTTSNIGGWKDCNMRNNICPKFKTVLPSELQAVIKTSSKYSDNVGSAYQIVTGYDASTGKNICTPISPDECMSITEDDIFLLSEYEVMGRTIMGNNVEGSYQQQYSFYALGDSRIRYAHWITTTAVLWWTRSVDDSNDCFWVCITGDGSTHNPYAPYSFGFCPAFCV